MSDEIKKQTSQAVNEIIKAAKLGAGDIFVVGCSSSEVAGGDIGKNSSIEIAKEIFEGIYPILCEKGIYLAAQCCEHLNRSIIIEREAAEKYGIDEVNVVPQIKAGGAFATTAYNNFKEPTAVEKIRAKAGIDIGGTLIGMHLKEVAVPLKISIKKIGEANIVCARTRPKFVGGVRAIYNENLL